MSTAAGPEPTTNDAWFERAGHVIPGGVNSPVRAFNSVGGSPYFVARASGATITDVEGVERIDLVQSYGAPTAREVRLAETVADRVPSVEKLRLVSSGTEATMTAIRIARGFTGRPTMVKFSGCYHGHSDALLVEGGTAMATLGLPASAG